MQIPTPGAAVPGNETKLGPSSGVQLECSAMTPGSSPAEAARNPVARSLALAVLGVALVAAAIIGGVVFAVLLALYAIGYLISFMHAWWRLSRMRRRAAFIDASPPPPANTNYVDGEYDVAEATADVAQRGSGGSA